MLNMSCKLFSSIPVENNNNNKQSRPHGKKDGQIELKYILQFPAKPAHFLGLTEKTFAHLPKMSSNLKTDFL